MAGADARRQVSGAAPRDGEHRACNADQFANHQSGQ